LRRFSSLYHGRLADSQRQSSQLKGILVLDTPPAPPRQVVAGPMVKGILKTIPLPFCTFAEEISCFFLEKFHGVWI
jgi:hypothetical protein